MHNALRNSRLNFAVFLLALAGTTGPGLASAAEPRDHDTQAVVAVVEHFGRALAAGEMEAVADLLDADVLILESGGAERNRAEYLREHAPEDAKFLKAARTRPGQRRVRVDGNLAWVGSESELEYQKDGKARILLSSETMVLRRSAGAWKIVHIHWSSRPKATP